MEIIFRILHFEFHFKLFFLVLSIFYNAIYIYIVHIGEYRNIKIKLISF